MNEPFLDDEFFDAKYKLQNCIRITTSIEDFTTEVYTGLRWIPVSEYVKALLTSEKRKTLDQVEQRVIGDDETEYLDGKDIGPNSVQADRNSVRAKQRATLTAMHKEVEG